jgi:membrane protease YdiL (CAAX protease family)
MKQLSEIRKAALILAAIAVTEGIWVLINLRANPRRFLGYFGFFNGHSEPLGWGLSIFVFVAFTAFARRLPSVRATLFAVSGLKLLALAVAITAGLCEEAIFRKLLMDTLARHEFSTLLQVLASALAFGLMHGIWGTFRGSFTAAVGATLATGALGLALALVYIASHRLLAPCVVSHFLINALAEPGLVLAAVRGEMGARREDM